MTTSAQSPEFRAGGIDLQDRRYRVGPIVDITQRADLSAITVDPMTGQTAIGSLVTVDRLATDPLIAGKYPGLSLAAAGLATPQVRRVATFGGNLLQRNRCPYFRSADFTCFQHGGDTCHAPAGNHGNGVIFDLGPCIQPHPSTLALAVLAYDARVALDDGTVMDAAALYGDGADPHRDHTLPPGLLLTGVQFPSARAGERAAYQRVISRREAEWSSVEALALVVVDQGLVTLARVAVGAVARIPLRLPLVEAALRGHAPDDDLIARATSLALWNTTSADTNRHKVQQLTVLLKDVIGAAILGHSQRRSQR
jgi:xanthine dehydrogenase YagS FAD-binding subunit